MLQDIAAPRGGVLSGRQDGAPTWMMTGENANLRRNADTPASSVASEEVLS